MVFKIYFVLNLTLKVTINKKVQKPQEMYQFNNIYALHFKAFL